MLTLTQLRKYHHDAAMRARDTEQWHEQQMKTASNEANRNHHARVARMAKSSADWHLEAAEAIDAGPSEADILKAARVLSDRAATVNAADKDRTWLIYSHLFIADARAMLEAIK